MQLKTQTIFLVKAKWPNAACILEEAERVKPRKEIPPFFFGAGGSFELVSCEGVPSGRSSPAAMTTWDPCGYAVTVLGAFKKWRDFREGKGGDHVILWWVLVIFEGLRCDVFDGALQI